MKQAIWLLLFLLIALQARTSVADESMRLFEAGNQRYEDGDYAAAIDAYEQIVASGKHNWQVYYNLGNAYYRQGSIGRAILNYERALQLNPNSDDIRFNLELANLATVDRIPAPPAPAWWSWSKGLLFTPSLSLLGWLTLIFYATFLLLFSLKYFRPAISGRVEYRGLVWVTLTGFVLVLLLFGFRWFRQQTDLHAVVLQRAVDVRSAPSRDATEVFALHEGTKVQIKQFSNGWTEIRLRDGKVGWLPSASIEKI